MEWTCEAGFKGEVYHCPLHKAAKGMYEALKELTEFDEMGGNGKDHYVLVRNAQKALAKVDNPSAL